MADRKTRLESYFDTVCKNIQDMVAKSSANNEDKQSICEALNELMKVHLKYKTEFMTFFQPLIQHQDILKRISNFQESSCLEERTTQE